jgi:hypothetical protein
MGESLFFWATFAWLLIGYGMTETITNSSLFAPVRKAIRIRFLSRLITCFFCTSVWVMGFLSAILYGPSHFIFEYTGHHPAIFIFTDAMLGSTLLYFLLLIEQKLK